MAVGHEQIMGSKHGRLGQIVRAVHRHMLAEDIVVPNQNSCWRTLILEVLRRFTNHTTSVKMIVRPDTRHSCQVDVGAYNTIRANLNGLVDDCVRSNLRTRIDLCLWVDDGRRMNHAPKVRQLFALPSQKIRLRAEGSNRSRPGDCSLSWSGNLGCD